MACRTWHITRADGKLQLSRRLPASFDVAAETVLPAADPLRLAHQIRQDMWRKLQSLCGFSPVVEITAEGQGLRVRAGAHVIRAVPGMESPGAWHSHDLDFQMVYVTKGWVVFEYEGQGEHLLRAGSCVLQPPGIKHRECRHSDDMELIEIISPAAFETRDETAP
ncbi:hypothetical protein SPO1095 [Ruegeria pomeroyi DSS-3]|uniref:Cupin type-2 domain-containing protein n=2 Tax=Ruegeria pomeroyi TaxID=89184 RepID=Q5LUF9_RUEPO|nr:hypothetical protein SPO1095 [Ruegeria pomeroyi DSS-3]